jgi:polar amino acid transport system substrate-binding protein
MIKSRMYTLGAVLLALVVGVALIAGCGSSSSSSSSSSASASPSAAGQLNGQLTGSAMDNFTQILGHAPTGRAAKIAQGGVIVVANDPNYAPQSYVDPKTKKLIGFDVDTAVTMAKILNLKIKWVHPNWETIPSALSLGQFDVSIGSMTDTKDREKQMSFSQPYYYTPAQVFVKKGGPAVSSVNDLAGKSVGVGAGTTYYTYLKKFSKADVKTYNTDLDALPDLLNGNIDFWMTAAPTGLGAINDGKAIDFSGKPLYFEALCFATKKDESDLIAVFNYALDKMHEIPAGQSESLLTQSSKKWYNGVDLTVTNGVKPLVF